MQVADHSPNASREYRTVGRTGIEDVGAPIDDERQSGL